MDDREELAALRRLAELEAKAKQPDPVALKRTADASAYAGDFAPGGDVQQMGSVMRGVGGAKHAWDKAAYGLKGLFTDLSPEEKAQLAQGEAFTKEAGTAGTVGEIGGDIAMTAAPALKGMQGVQWGARAIAPALPRVAAMLGNPLTAAGAGGAATGALVNPEDRAGGAVRGGVGAAAGEGVARVFTKALGVIAASKVGQEARELMDQGINLPMWKALEPGNVARNMAERVRSLPVVGPLMKSQEAAAMRDYNKVLIRDATPPVPVLNEANGVLSWQAAKDTPVGEIGQEGMRALHGRFNDAYNALYRGRAVPVDDAFAGELHSISSAADAYTPGIAADVNGAIRRVNDTLRKGTETTRNTSQILDAQGNPIVTEQLGHAAVAPGNVTRALDDVNDAVSSAWQKGDGEKAKVLEQVRDALTSLRERGLPPEVQSMLKPVNDAYANYKLLQRASGAMGAVRNEGVVTPLQMTNAVKAADKTPGKSATTQGIARGQQDAQRAQRVLGSELPEVGPGTAEKAALTAGLLGLGWMAPAALGGAAFLTRPGQKALMGGYGWQGGVRDATDRIADLMRSGGIAANN